MSLTTLYRFYDADDRLLYIGISERGPERRKAHRKDKPWWGELARTTTEHYETRAEALEAERAAIVAEKPLHNVVHNGGKSRPCTITDGSPRSRRYREPHRYAGLDQWSFYGSGGHERRCGLVFYWEVNGDPISDNYYPHEISALELLHEWARNAKSDTQNIYWYLEGTDGVFEYAPGAPNAADWGDFRKHYTRPIHIASGTLFRPEMVPVADKLWGDGRGDKGGFIQSATGWKPALYQPQVSVQSLLDLARMRNEVT